MCNCNFGVVSGNVSVQRLMEDNDLKRIVMEDTLIKKDCFMKNDPEAMFLIAWCFDRNTFKERFSRFKDFAINGQADVIAIANAHKAGKDMEIYKVNFLDLIKDIEKDPSKIHECGITFCDQS